MHGAKQKGWRAVIVIKFLGNNIQKMFTFLFIAYFTILCHYREQNYGS